MLVADEWRASYSSDADLLNGLAAKLNTDSGGGDLVLGPRTYWIDTPVELPSGVRLRGEGALATCLKATSELTGPVVMSAGADQLLDSDAWFHDEGVPVRFHLRDLSVNAAQARVGDAPWSGCGVYLYGKGFEIRDIEVIDAPRAGIVSKGSARGGQKDWRDAPEAIFDVRVSGCRGDGFVMRGPHDSIIRQAIIARCGGRGLAVEAGPGFNGACDIDFCHAYATDGTAIDLAAKVKAGFLQGDTGRTCGVRIGGSDKTYVDRVESFKTRGGPADYAVEVKGIDPQIGLMRVRADWGAAGVLVAAHGAQIGLLDIEGKRNTGGPIAGTENDLTALHVKADAVSLPSVNVRNFTNGTGILLDPGKRGLRLAGTTRNCATHLDARNAQGCTIDLDSFPQPGQVSAVFTGTEGSTIRIREHWKDGLRLNGSSSAQPAPDPTGPRASEA